MRLEQLEYLISIKNNKSMHAAARELFVSQQGISKAMKELEEELHTKIFNRTSTGTYLTADGQDIYLHARKIIDEVNLIKEKYSFSYNRKLTFNNILKIYVSNHVFNFASDYIYHFSTTFDAKINIIEIGTREIISTFENDADAELAIVQAPIEELERSKCLVNGYNCYVLANERLKVAMNKQSEYAQYASISLKTLSEIPLLINTTSIENLPIHVQVLTDRGVDLNIQFITNSKTSEKYLKDNVACALCTDLNYKTVEDNSFTCMVPIKEKIFVATCLLVKKEGVSGVSEAFVNDLLSRTNAECVF